jgi:restriction system protein
MNPYDFQDLVADLLRAMSYHVTWVSPPGKDGGVDILAWPDALGTRPPRIKVRKAPAAGRECRGPAVFHGRAGR